MKALPGLTQTGQRGDLGVLAPAAGEEVADRAFDRGLGLAVPVDAQDGEAPGAGRGQPDLLDGALALDIGHDEGLPGLDRGRRARPSSPGRGRGPPWRRAVGGHAGLALLAGEVLRADGAGLGVRQAGEVAQAHAEAVECCLSSSEAKTKIPKTKSPRMSLGERCAFVMTSSFKKTFGGVHFIPIPG